MKKVTFSILIIAIIGLLAYYYAERRNISLIQSNSEIVEKVYFFDNSSLDDKEIKKSNSIRETEENLEI